MSHPTSRHSPSASVVTLTPSDRLLTLVREIMRAMVLSPQIHTALDAITTGLVEALSVRAARVWLYRTDIACAKCRAEGSLDAKVAGLHLYSAAGASGTVSTAEHRISLGRFLMDKVLVPRRMLVVDEVETDPHLEPWVHSAARQMHAPAFAAYPLVFRDEPLGVLVLWMQHPFTKETASAIQVIADQAALAIKASSLLAETESKRRRLAVENEYLRTALGDSAESDGIISAAPAIAKLLGDASLAAQSDVSVMITGETGTGKELFARAVHRRSKRASRPMIVMNCGAITSSLAESELFGHERGSFTGASARRHGRFELANGSTLFMDEVGELPLDIQAKLLRVLETGEFVRVGGERPIRTDFRLICATNRDLADEVRAGRFREDLYFRINVFELKLPPLRERVEDIPPLVEFFLRSFERTLAKRFTSVSAGSMEAMKRYPWPGNVRELRNVMERACVLAKGPVVSVNLSASPLAMSRRADAGTTLEAVERAHIEEVLAATQGRIDGAGGAAKILGINPSTLRSRMVRMGIKPR